jgi:secreted trypsin-like serine protease
VNLIRLFHRGFPISRGKINDVTKETSPKLLFVRLPIVSNSECTKIYGSIVTSSNVCLSSTSTKSTCQGDSGGPLTITSGTKQIQVGVVSFGSEKGCQKGFPTVFARVSSFHNWIQTTTGITIQ